jgi:hypothetical protein
MDIQDDKQEARTRSDVFEVEDDEDPKPSFVPTPNFELDSPTLVRLFHTGPFSFCDLPFPGRVY